MMKIVNVDTGEETEVNKSGVIVEHGIQDAIAGTGLKIWQFADGHWSYAFSIMGDRRRGQSGVGVSGDGYTSEYDALRAFLLRLTDHDIYVEVYERTAASDQDAP